MFKDFETTKQQLAELAEVVNKFKSEAVQLKLLELLFDSTPHEIEGEEGVDAEVKPKKRVRKKRASTKKAAVPAKDNKAPRKPSSFGPTSILKKLYDEDFFAKPKTISDICQYSDANLARKIKPNEISGKLARMVRNGDLSREKNSDNQYEYTKP